MRGLQREQWGTWAIALACLPLCWWLQPSPVPRWLLVLLLLLLTVLTLVLWVGRLGTRKVRFSSAAVFYTRLLYGLWMGAAISLLAGVVVQGLRRQERSDVLLYTLVLALSALVSGMFYHFGRRTGNVIPSSWLDWLRLLGAAVLFTVVRVLLMWWYEGARCSHRRYIARVEVMVWRA